MDVQRDDEQGRTQRYKERALGSLRWAESVAGPGNLRSAFEGTIGRHYFHFMRSSCGASSLRRRSYSRDARARPRGVSDHISCSAAIWRQQRIDDLGGSPGELLKQALQLLSPEPQPGPRWGGMLAGVMVARARNSGGMR
jgi:hypothetical protein